MALRCFSDVLIYSFLLRSYFTPASEAGLKQV